MIALPQKLRQCYGKEEEPKLLAATESSEDMPNQQEKAPQYNNQDYTKVLMSQEISKRGFQMHIRAYCNHCPRPSCKTLRRDISESQTIPVYNLVQPRRFRK